MLQPRYHQEQALNSFFNYTANNWGKNPIIVLPTGGGKSLVQAYILKHMLEYPNTRILLLTHQKQLIKQNVEEFIKNFDKELFLDIGIYSAGLNKRDTPNRIIFAGIQSVYKRAWELGWFDLILIDECHLIPHKNFGMYRAFLEDMRKINKNVITGGLSATPFRMKDGLLTDGDDAFFDDICHETTLTELINPNDYRNLDNKQYLCNLISKGAQKKVDLSNVHIRAGEFKHDELEQAFMTGDLVCTAIKEIIGYTHDRKKVLTFTAGIKHCKEVTQKMISLGLDARCVHSQQNEEINEQNIQDFKDGKFKYLNNVKVLTTGFNEKSIDCIVLLMSTKSPGLYIQMVGRGSRLYPGKENCLILDFGKNIERHGPVDKIEIRKKGNGKSEITTAPQKECPECQALLHLSAVECPDCGYIFPQKDKHEEKASKKNILSKWEKPEEINIERISYTRHSKKGKPDSLRVDYYYNMYDKYSTWVCIEHDGFARKKALQWFGDVTEYNINTVEEALEHCQEFKEPKKIIVDLNGKFPNIIGYIFNEPEKINNNEILEIENADEALESLLW